MECQKLISDLGGESEATWYEMCEDMGIDSRIAASHAPWQKGSAERHEQIFGIMFDKVVLQLQVHGQRRCRKVLMVCIQAQNATMTRNGITFELPAFGRVLRWPGTTNTDDDHHVLAVHGSDAGTWEPNHMRAAAKIALRSKDACDKVRRAMLRKAPKVVEELCPRTCVYFWAPHPIEGSKLAT